MTNVRRYSQWQDKSGRFVTTSLYANATLSSVSSALMAKSVGALLYSTESGDQGPTQADVGGAYDDTIERAVLIFTDASGYNVPVLLPMPLSSIFLADNVTVDETKIATIKAAVIGTVLSAAGLPALTYKAGWRSSAGTQPAGIPPAPVPLTTYNIAQSGTLVGAEPELNLIPGANVTLTATDNAGASRVDVTIAASAPGAGQLVNLYDNLLIATAATFNLTSISAGYLQLLLYAYLRTNSGNTEDLCQLTFNGSATGYDWEEVFGSAGGAGGQAGLGATYIRAGAMPGGGATAGRFGTIKVDIPNYAGTTGNKALTAQSARVQAQQTVATAGDWANTAAISRITLTPGAGSWAIGSRVTLYGLS